MKKQTKPTSKALQIARGDDPARWREDAYPRDYQGQVQRAIGFSGISHDFFILGKAKWLSRFLQRHEFQRDSTALLDIGCGIGLLHSYLRKQSNRIVGVDLSQGAIATARKSNPGNEYFHYSGEVLPFDSCQFDVALAVTVMHHVPVDRWPVFVSEAHRVLKPGGALVIIEHNPWNPLTRLAVNRCDFDADAVLLTSGTARKLLVDAGFRDVGTDYIFFTPFENRIIQSIETRLRSFPLGAQYISFGFRDTRTG